MIILQYIHEIINWVIGYHKGFCFLYVKDYPVEQHSIEEVSQQINNKISIIQDHGDEPKVNISSIKEDIIITDEAKHKENVKILGEIDALLKETPNTTVENITNKDEGVKSFYLRNLEVNMSLLNEISYQQQVHDLCSSEEEFEQYLGFVNENIMNWKDVIIHIKGWEEHMEGMHIITTQSMYNDLNITEMREPLNDYLIKVGYSQCYIMNAIGAHFEVVGDDIALFRKFRHLFTDNDIQLEINLNDQERLAIQYWFEKTIDGELTANEFKQLLVAKMRNLGYSTNYIRYTLLKFKNKLKEVRQAIMEQQENSGE